MKHVRYYKTGNQATDSPSLLFWLTLKRQNKTCLRHKQSLPSWTHCERLSFWWHPDQRNRRIFWADRCGWCVPLTCLALLQRWKIIFAFVYNFFVCLFSLYCSFACMCVCAWCYLAHRVYRGLVNPSVVPCYPAAPWPVWWDKNLVGCDYWSHTPRPGCANIQYSRYIKKMLCFKFFSFLRNQ